MGKRYFSLDYARGIAILGMIFCHSFLGRVANWDTTILFDFAKKTPLVVLVVVFVPVCIACCMGSLFSFITAVCVTMSSIKIKEKGMRPFLMYIFNKIIFAIILKAMEDFWSQALEKCDIFKLGVFSFPVTELRYFGNTIDCVGLFSWSVPLIVVGLQSMSWLKDYRIQVGILTIISFIWWFFNHSILYAFTRLGIFFKNKEYYIFYYICMKMSDGYFAIGQYFPFGLIGGAFGILLNYTNKFSYYWIYTIILGVVGLSFGIPLMLTEKDSLMKVFGPIRPTGFLFIVNFMQIIAILICMHISDNPQRSVQKRYNSAKKTTFLRRINMLSLTAYIVEIRFNMTIFTIYQSIFGPASDFNTSTCLWPWYIIGLYMTTSTVIWAFVCVLWEKASFRFSAESQLGAIMSWFFNQPYNRMDYKACIYGAVSDVQQEIDLLSSQTVDVQIEVIPVTNVSVELQTVKSDLDKGLC